MLQCVAVCCSVLQCVAHINQENLKSRSQVSYLRVTSHMCNTNRSYTARIEIGESKVCCSVLQCVAVCCSVLQCVHICATQSTLTQHISTPIILTYEDREIQSVLQCVAVCCSVFQCVAVSYTAHINTNHSDI